MAFVAPSAQDTTQQVSLRASASAKPAQPSMGSGAWGVAGTAAAMSVLGLASRRSSGKAVARQVVGVCLPLTEKFDPLGLGTEAKMERYTQVEIKHGRVACLPKVWP